MPLFRIIFIKVEFLERNFAETVCKQLEDVAETFERRPTCFQRLLHTSPRHILDAISILYAHEAQRRDHPLAATARPAMKRAKRLE